MVAQAVPLVGVASGGGRTMKRLIIEETLQIIQSQLGRSLIFIGIGLELNKKSCGNSYCSKLMEHI